MKKVALAFIGFLVVIMVVAICENFLLNKKLTLLDSRLKQIPSQVEKIKEEISSIGILSDYLKDRSFSLDILKEIHARIPDSVFLTSLELNRNDNLTLQGQTNKISEVFLFVSSLEESTYFSNVNVHDITVNGKVDEKVVIFKIYCSIKTDNR